MSEIRFPFLLALLLGSGFAGSGADSFSLPPMDSPEWSWWRDSMKTREARLAWWREARFGMFVHWGVYSTLGNEYQGRPGVGYAEHIQRALKIPIPEYRAEVAGRFNPVHFNADDWIRTATNTGMGYFVITAKHHDGVAMWPSEVHDYNIARCTPFQRDPMAELRDACRRHGVKFGIYYSHAFDWGAEDGPGNDWDYDNPGGDRRIGGRDWWEAQPGFMSQARNYVDRKSIPQLLELVRRYDPDLFWFDTPHKLPDSENLRIFKAVREASLRVVINGRLLPGLGDYASTADRPAEFPPQEGDWEGIPTTNESYAWNRVDRSHKSPGHFIRLLVKAAARGGNLLMNIGPMGDGRIDPADRSILEGIGAWWQVNGESIRGTTRTPLPVQAWGESTRKGHTLYLHVFQWPFNGVLVVGGLKSNVKGARLLGASGPVALDAQRLNALDVSLSGLPTTAPNAVDSVIALAFDGEISVDAARLLQPDCQTNTLHVFDGRLVGEGLAFGPGKTRDAYVLGWTRADQGITWPARLNPEAVFDVWLTYDATRESAGGRFAVSCGGRTLEGTVKAGARQSQPLGRVTLEPGLLEIRLSALDIQGGELMRPRELILRRPADLSGSRSSQGSRCSLKK